MKRWQHIIDRVRYTEGKFLVSGDTYEHNNNKLTRWCFLIDSRGELVSTIEPNEEFYHYTMLCKCICEYIKENRILLLFNSDEAVVYQSNENGEFSREI